jgi:hypothetical protein
MTSSNGACVFEVADTLGTITSMLACELFPELATQIFHDLRGLKRHDLAAQIMTLRVVDRCRCGSALCGTFYTEEADLRKGIVHGTDIMLECGANVTEVDGRIVEIETLDPHVTDTLREVFP